MGLGAEPGAETEMDLLHVDLTDDADVILVLNLPQGE